MFANSTHNDPPVGTPFRCLYQSPLNTPTEDSKLILTRSTSQAMKSVDQSGLHSSAASLRAEITSDGSRES